MSAACSKISTQSDWVVCNTPTTCSTAVQCTNQNNKRANKHVPADTTSTSSDYMRTTSFSPIAKTSKVKTVKKRRIEEEGLTLTDANKFKQSRLSNGHPKPQLHFNDAALRKWVCDFDSVLKWFNKLQRVKSFERQLEESGGLIKIRNFLPPKVANDALRLFESLPEETWRDTSAERNYTENNITHQFASARGDASGVGLPGLLAYLLRVFAAVFGDKLSSFSAGRYGESDHIEPHDDEARTNFNMEDGSIQLCSRDVALIFYLTKDWNKKLGGLFVDHGIDEAVENVPEFNSAILFKVPRLHAVTAVTGERFRYSIYGWFHHDPM
eukprot:m.137114 g.137114  ORF g.137114 m.137114 type:complete len:326 (-) comp29905_c0_seq1:335-1312(-)